MSIWGNSLVNTCLLYSSNSKLHDITYVYDLCDVRDFPLPRLIAIQVIRAIHIL
jgi:hypothetical protein